MKEKEALLNEIMEQVRSLAPEYQERVLDAENNNLTDFSFINGATKLHVLMLAGNHSELAQTNMTTWLAGLTELEVLTLSDIKLTDLSFLQSMEKLARLDIANCGLGAFTAETSNIDYIANCYGKLRILDISDNNMAGSEDELLKLRNLSLLTVLYADNVCDDLDVYTLTYSMPELMYISMENCGVDTLRWLFKYNNLAYVDLAGNDISSVCLESDFSNASIKTLKELYLDTNVPCTFADAYRVSDFNVEKLSLAGVSVNRIEHLPYLDSVKYLNLSNTGLSTLVGDDAELVENFSIERYATVETIDVSGLELDISALENLPKLSTVYAVGTADSKLFHEGNLHALQRMYNAGSMCYLYDKHTAYKPVATAEGTEILALLKDISCDVIVAADNVFSDNNPFMVDEVNGFDITWSVSNTDNYEIVDNYLSVRDYTGIDDEELTITAQITVYPDQAPVTRKFKIKTNILRASAEYFETDATGYSKQMTRGKAFTYDLGIKADYTDGFNNPVKPVVDYITYDYAATSEIRYDRILTIGENHSYAITTDAPLDETVTIKINVGHITKDGTFVNDVKEITAPVTVASRTFIVNVILNGGQLVDANGTYRENFECVEDALIFEDLTVRKTGYLFEGWYTDAEFTQLYSLDGADAVMPSENITLYAKWKAHSFNLKFDPAGGTVSESARLVLCDVPFGELPVPTRTGYTFAGWYTANGEQITEISSMATAEDITVTAKWTIITYKAAWNTGTGYTITVKRTSSPYAGVASGILKSGDPIYYGDTLQVTYTKADYYTITNHGVALITVTRDVGPSDIYATATLNPISGWVKVSDLPSGAQVLNRKWSYSLTTTTESRETSLAGYSQTGSYWVQSNSGSFNYSDKFATYAPGFDTSHSIYQTLNKSPYTSYENTTSKRVVNNTWAGYVYWHWMYSTDAAAYNRAIYFQSGTGSSTMTGNNYNYKVFGAFLSGTNFAGQTNENWRQDDTYYAWYHVTDRSSNADTQGSYWFYRFDYYTCSYTDFYKMFQYKKVENKESTTQVNASGSISNVQEWVQYRAK